MKARCSISLLPVIVLAVLTANPLTANDRQAIVALDVFPPQVVLPADHRLHRLIVTGVTADGFELDLTRQAAYSSGQPDVAAVDDAGRVQGMAQGQATITARVGEHEVSVAVTVPAAPRQHRVTFDHNVLPVINRAGCNAATCHAKPDGQNGFKLTVFSYDPKSDYREIVQESRGRRVFPALATESLILKKPTMAVDHGGGLRFTPDSQLYLTLRQWIETGMAYSHPDVPKLVGIEVYPTERRYRQGAVQPLLVRARYDDDSVRDVTHLAKFESRAKQFVAVDEHGVITVTDQIGEQVILVRYMDIVEISRVIVPTEHELSPDVYASLAVNSYIDEHVFARLQKLGIVPSPPCTDGEFIRRASLDATGTLPTVDQTVAFLNDTDPHKRRKLIDRLLADGDYANYWATKWGDLIRPNPNRMGVKYTYILDQWLRQCLLENKPYDQFVRELIVASGPHNDPTTVIHRDQSDPAGMATLVSRMFLGVRIECAKCHHHPYEQWSQDDFYQFAAYFGQRGDKGGILCHTGEGEVKHPLTDEVMSPKTLDGPAPTIEPDTDPRIALADWMTSPDNPYFARAIVNRVWAEYFGRGIVHPVDDFRPTNPPTNAPLLDALAEDFIAHGYDLKHLMRTIMQSQVYQLSSEPNDYNVGDTQNHSRYYRRRLDAEVMLDAVGDVTGTRDLLQGVMPGARATETWNNKLGSVFLDSFGRPTMNVDCPCERNVSYDLIQALHMMNSAELHKRITHRAGRVAQMVNDKRMTVRDIVTDLYLAAYSRYPTDEEIDSMFGVLFKAPQVPGTSASPKSARQTATEDILWALLNSAEFVYNH